MNSTLSNNPQRQRGTQIVELALVTPLLLLLVFIVIEASSFIRIHQVVNNAAREGARTAAVAEGKNYIDAGGNQLGLAAACSYLNEHQKSLPSWGGGACGEPLEVKVEPVLDTDPDAVIVDGVPVPSTRAIVRYRYQPRYSAVFALFNHNTGYVDVTARAQFRNFY